MIQNLNHVSIKKVCVGFYNPRFQNFRLSLDYLIHFVLDGHHKDNRCPHTGLRKVPGLKRKTSKDDDEEEEEDEVSETQNSSVPCSKRIRSNNSPRCSSKSHCVIERSLSQGFASLLSTGDNKQ